MQKNGNLLTSSFAFHAYGCVGKKFVTAHPPTLGLLNRTWYASGTNYLTAFGPGAIPNPGLKWETTDKFNVGLDFGVLNQRIAGSIDVYNEKTHDLLLSRALPFTSGLREQRENVGLDEEPGPEVGVTTQNLQNWRPRMDDGSHVLHQQEPGSPRL